MLIVNVRLNDSNSPEAANYAQCLVLLYIVIETENVTVSEKKSRTDIVQ